MAKPEAEVSGPAEVPKGNKRPMSEIEKQLMSLADDSDSDSGISRSPSPAPPPRKKSTPPSSDSKPQSAPQPQKGVARKMNKRKAASRPKLTVEVDDDSPYVHCCLSVIACITDLLHSSSAPASPDSLGSGAMSESDVEDANPVSLSSHNAVAAARDGPRYPLEGKFISLKDKQEIMSLPDVRREQILSERMEEVERENFNKQLRERHEVQQKEAAVSADRKKRSAAVAELDETERKPTKKPAHLDAYMKKREEVQEQRRQTDDRRARAHSSPGLLRFGSRSSSEAEISGQTDAYYGKQQPYFVVSKRRGADVGPPVDLKAVERIRLGRSSLTSICYTPEFEIVARGCFVRVAIGPDPQQPRRTLYKLFHIDHVGVGPEYGIQTANENLLKTDQVFRVGPTTEGRDVPFTHCSDSPPTVAEFEEYKAAMASAGEGFARTGHVDRKVVDLRALAEYVFTPSELSAKIKRSGATRPRIDKLALHDARIRREAAEMRGDAEGVAKADAEIAAYMNRPKAQGAREIKAHVDTEQDIRIARLNAEIRRSNKVDVRKAQVVAKRKQLAHEAAVARGEAEINPFAKVKTVPQTFYDVNAKKSAGNGNSIQGVSSRVADEPSDSSRPATPASGTGKPTWSGGKPVRKKKMTDEDIFGSMDLEVDIEI